MAGQSGNRRRAVVLAVIAGLAAGSSAVGQGKADPRVSRVQAIPVVLGPIPILQTGPGGRSARVPGGVTDACNIVASHTDANFGGGSFVVQAGMSEQEQAAATYTLSAADFPIRINLTELIVATSGSSMTTTTQWTLSYYSGTPTAGTLIDSFSSDGTVLPHIVIAPGTNGVNLQFSIDPGDPEQIVIPDDGTHSFTVAFRIDHHNQQTQNPCFVAPPNCCNAFPCTDTSGVSQSGRNWLFGLNCGPFGCPANGGWATFASLPGGCRPSGDWVQRTTWSSVSCVPGVGACCLPNGTCEVLTVGDCQIQNGLYRGDGSSCATANCPVPTGACCTAGGCGVETQADCTIVGGVWQGPGTTCVGGQCPTGACCLPDGSCVPNVSSAQCTAQNGVYRGANSTCAQANCPQPTGACCFSTGGCLLRTQAQCASLSGNWNGPGTTCPVGGCTQPCYANCDGSTISPVLNVNDFTCFMNRYAAGDSYANCDASTVAPVLNVNDFICFNNRYASGCQ